MKVCAGEAFINAFNTVVQRFSLRNDATTYSDGSYTPSATGLPTSSRASGSKT